MIIPKLQYLSDTPYVPLTPSDRALQTIEAKPWFKVADEGIQLEGLCSDRNGDIYFVEVFGGRIMKLIVSEMKLIDIYKAEDMKPAAVKIHKDGRLFICCLGNHIDTGCVFALSPDGKDMEMIVPPGKYTIDDLVFDSDGGFYFTDFKGLSFRPDGGVYYVSPDYKTITPIAGNMAGANGVALSKDESKLWVTETNFNRLTRIKLLPDRVTVPAFGAHVPYCFTGCNGPDSCCIDSDDNLYVAMAEKGYVMVFNPNGYPIGEVLIPGRESGHMLRSTHPMLRPGTDELIICANDWDGGQGSWLFIARGFAEAHKSYQFQ